MNSVSRLMYLAAELRPPVPPKRIMQLIPQGELIAAVARYGLNGALAQFDLPEQQIHELYNDGVSNLKGDDTEFKMLIGQLASAQLDMRRDDLTLEEYLLRMRELADYVTNQVETLVDIDEADLGDEYEVASIPKFETGFSPLDYVVGGFYQGIVTIVGKPGSGKTTLLLRIMEDMRKNAGKIHVSKLWFFELEISKNLMLYRMKPQRARTKFVQGDKMFCGLITTREILQKIEDDPDPDRVIFFDGPDVAAAGQTAEAMRMSFTSIYRDLVRIKERSKIVFVTSQARRKDRELTQESVSESWAKSQYSDIILTIHPYHEKMTRGYTPIRVFVGKNRFGIAQTDTIFNFNYSNITWEDSDFAGSEYGTGVDDW